MRKFVMVLLVAMLLASAALAETKTVVVLYTDGMKLVNDHDFVLVGSIGNLGIIEVPDDFDNLNTYADGLFLGCFEPSEFPVTLMNIVGLEIAEADYITCNGQRNGDETSPLPLLCTVILSRAGIDKATPFFLNTHDEELVWLTLTMPEGSEHEYFRYYTDDDGFLTLPPVGEEIVLGDEKIEKPELVISRVDWNMIYSDITFTSPDAEASFRELCAQHEIIIPDEWNATK